MMRKIRPSHKYTYLAFLIFFLVLTFLFWAIFGTKSWSFTGDYLKERLWVDLTYTGISLLVCIVGLFIYQKKVYYIVEENKITRVSNKKREYFFNDIVYLDETYTNKHGDILIFINSNNWVYLTKDKKGELIKIIKSKCPLLKKEDFIEKFPKVKIPR